MNTTELERLCARIRALLGSDDRTTVMEVWALTPRLVEETVALIAEHGELHRRYMISEQHRRVIAAVDPDDPDYTIFDSGIVDMIRSRGSMTLSDILTGIRSENSFGAVQWNAWRVRQTATFAENVMVRRLQVMRTEDRLAYQASNNGQRSKGWYVPGKSCELKKLETKRLCTRPVTQFNSFRKM